MTLDERFMRLALELAARAGDRTRPNPRVGAVVVKRGRVISRAFHRRAGLPHAEVLALRQAGAAARGATLYVTLEPCAHTGRTPPCTEPILKSGVRRVVAAMIDPNPKNRGRGLKILRRGGTAVRAGLLEKEARRLNPVFITWMTRKRPFVTVKVAQSLDGKIATAGGESRWISGPASRRMAHRLRAQADGILVGVETLLKDNPRLTVRGMKTVRPPVRVVLDAFLRTPPRARLFSAHSPVWIACSTGASRAREQRLHRAGAEVIRFPARKGRVNLPALLRRLAGRGISHLLIEGGGETIASAFSARAVDRVVWITAPKILGGRTAPTSVEGEGVSRLLKAIQLKDPVYQKLGPDWVVTAEVRYPKSR